MLLLTSVFSPLRLPVLAPYVITSCLSSFLRISQTGRTFLICAGIFGNRNPTGDFTGNNFILLGMQISPNKDMNFRYASASFTVSPVPGRNHVVLTYPKTRPYMMFLFVTSYLCHPASFRPHLTVTPSESALTCHRLVIYVTFHNVTWNTYRGL